MKETEFTSYADDNTLYNAGNTIEDVISSLQESFESISDLLNQREISPYNLRRHPEFRVTLTRTVYRRVKVSHICV